MTNDTIYAKAREMLSDGYSGQNMRNPERAALYIKLAAENPNVTEELPETGRSFWKSADFHYRMWKKLKPPPILTYTELERGKQIAKESLVARLEANVPKHFLDLNDNSVLGCLRENDVYQAACLMCNELNELRDELLAWARE